jgi:adenylylsulfate kinase-like enzyme
MPTAPVILVVGVPGAGKSTVARGLAQRFARSACIEGDLVQHHFTVSGLVAPGQDPHSEMMRQLELRWRNCAALADNFAQDGFTAVVEHAASSRHWIDLFLRHLTTRSVSLIVLAPRLEVTLARDAQRAEKQVASHFTYMDAELRRELTGLGWWLDSSELTPDETVDEVFRTGIAAGVLEA